MSDRERLLLPNLLSEGDKRVKEIYSGIINPKGNIVNGMRKNFMRQKNIRAQIAKIRHIGTL